MTDGISDAEAIVASQATPERFALIFDRHYPAIQGYLRRRIERSSADDLAAETFIVAFRRRKDYEPSQADARPWLFGIAVNLLRRHRRHERRQLRAYARTAVDPLLSGTAGAAHGVDDPEIGPHLARALASLASRDREVLFLYACADLSYEEIAVALGIPTGTVRSRLFRARRRIRELLSDEVASEGERTRQQLVQPRGAR